MFEYLREHEAVVSGDVLFVRLGSGQYAISGEHRATSYGYGNSQISIAKGEVLQRYTAPVKKLVKVFVGDTEYSAEQYYKLNSVDVDDLATLEEEFAHRKLLESLHNGEEVYEETPEVFTPVEITIVGEVKDTGSKYITTPLVYGKARFNNYDNGFYKLDITQLLKDIVVKFCEDNKLFLKSPQGNSWKFAQINGQYFATGSDMEKYADNAVRILATLDEAKELEDSVRNEILSYLRGKFNFTQIDAVTAAQLFTDVEQVRGRLAKLDVKKNSDSELSSIRLSLSKLLNKLGGLK